MKLKSFLALSLLVFCFFLTNNVYADTKDCSARNYYSFEEAEKFLKSIKLHDESKTTYQIGDKVYVDIYGEPRDTSVTMSVTLRKVNELTPNYTTWLKNTVGTDDDKGQAYFVIPDFLGNGEYEVWFYTYYKETKEIQGYYSVDGEQMPIYKEKCRNYMPSESEANAWDGVYIPNSTAKFTVVEKKEEVKDILESIEFKEPVAYFGSDYQFTVKTKEPISKVVLQFLKDRGPATQPTGYFDTYAFFDSDATTNTATVAVPTYGVNYVYPGDYKLTGVIVYDKNNNMTSYTTDKYLAQTSNYFVYFDSNTYLKLEEPQSNFMAEGYFELRWLNYSNTNAVIGERVPIEKEFYFDEGNYGVKSVLLTFYNDINNTMFSSYLKDINNESYIIVPSIAKEGTYRLQSAVIVIKDLYNNDEFQSIVTESDMYKAIFDQTITVKEPVISNKDASVLYFNAFNLDEASYDVINASKSTAIINIYAGEQEVIPSRLFYLIKDTTRQLIIESNGNEWVFNGTDIEEVKPLNVSMELTDLENTDLPDNIKKSFGTDAMAVVFPNNGSLPGKALIRIKNQTLYKNMTGDKFYIYYVDEAGHRLNRVATEIQKSYNGYVEFYINHNSTYIISNTEVTDNEVLGNDEQILKVNSPNAAAISTPEEASNALLYMLIGASFVVILGIIVLLISNKKTQKLALQIAEDKEESKDKKDKS